MANGVRRALIALVFLSGCASGDTGTNPDPEAQVEPVTISLAPTSAVVDVGATLELAVTVSGGQQGAAHSWTCLSSDSQVASADKTSSGCEVTGRGPGVATASAVVSEGTSSSVATATVTVRPPPSDPPPLEASLEPSVASVDEGHTIQLQLQLSGGSSGDPADWACASSDLQIATVTTTVAGCDVTGTGAGEATVTVNVTKGSEATSANSVVTVIGSPFPPLQVFFQPNSAFMSQAQTVEMSLLVLGGDPIAGTNWTCTATDPAIAAAVVTELGCAVTGFGAGATTVVAVVTRGVMVTQVSGNVTVVPVSGRSQADPAALGEAVTVIVDDATVPWTTLRLTLLQTVTGTAAQAMANSWSATNDPPPPGFEYIMARFRLEVLDQTDPSAAYLEAELNFESVSGTGVVHPAASVCCNSPSLGQQGFEGATWEGWIDVLSENTDNLPKAVYRRGETSEAWFELKPAP